MKEQAEEHEESQFNAAIATLKRIDAVKRQIDIATDMNDNIMHWRNLRTYYKELDPHFNANDRELQEKRFEEMRIYYRTWERSLKLKLRKIPDVETVLDLWERELRRLEQKYGLNMPKKFDPRWAMASR